MIARLIQVRNIISRLLTARGIIANDPGVGVDYSFDDYSSSDYA